MQTPIIVTARCTPNHMHRGYATKRGHGPHEVGRSHMWGWALFSVIFSGKPPNPRKKHPNNTIEPLKSTICHIFQIWVRQVVLSINIKRSKRGKSAPVHLRTGLHCLQWLFRAPHIPHRTMTRDRSGCVQFFWHFTSDYSVP